MWRIEIQCTFTHPLWGKPNWKTTKDSNQNSYHCPRPFPLPLRKKPLKFCSKAHLPPLTIFPKLPEQIRNMLSPPSPASFLLVQVHNTLPPRIVPHCIH